MLTPSHDAGLFDVLHRAIGQESLKDRRVDVRHPFPYWQLVANFDGHSLPVTSDFHPVRCRDVSPRGFSFVAGFEYADQVVIALGKDPLHMFVAEVVRREEHEVEGGKIYEAGCRFVRRLT